MGGVSGAGDDVERVEGLKLDELGNEFGLAKEMISVASAYGRREKGPAV